LIPAAIVFSYLGVILYIGIFAWRGHRTEARAEDYFLAGRSLGPVVFLLSLFGTNMTAFTILGSAGHSFANGIVTFSLMASASAFVIPLTLFFVGTRLWSLGKQHGFITPVQMLRDRWECAHIGTVIFALQAGLLVPYIIIGVMGGGTALGAITGGFVPFWLGGAVVALVVMSYVFLGGMRGTAWVNAFQTVLFLSFGANGSPRSTTSATRSSRFPPSPFRTSRSSVSPRGVWCSSSTRSSCTRSASWRSGCRASFWGLRPMP
jgi:SSS family solute:Na+ symporter